MIDIYQVKDFLVRKAMWGNYVCKIEKLGPCTGYLEAKIDSIGRSYLEYCYSKIYDIHRLPGYESRYRHEFSIKEGVEGITIEDIENSCNELRRMAAHSQTEMKKAGMVKDGKVTLIRTLNVIQVENVKQQRDNENIILPVNILTSYGVPGVPTGYNGGEVVIKREVPIEKIAMWYKCIEYPCDEPNRGNCMYKINDETYEYEVWVIEDDIRGHIIMPHDMFFMRFKEEEKKSLGLLGINSTCRSSEVYDEDRIDSSPPLAYSNSNRPLPCEYNKRTKRIIKKNKEKIDKYCFVKYH